MFKKSTPQKFNMESEKKSLEKEIPFGNHHFQVRAVNLRGSILKSSQEEVAGNNKTPVVKLPRGLGWCILAKNPTALVDTG